MTVAVLDTGVAYRDRGRCPRSARSTSRRTSTCRRSPDFRDGDFVAGYDFVDDDPRPNDENGHGTHVAGTIGEGTDDNVGVTGLAYGARIMPVRVLDRLGEGDSVAISAGIRYAAAPRRRRDQPLVRVRHAGRRAREIPDILAALRYARRKGVLVVGASGNAARAQRRLPGARRRRCSRSAPRPSTAASPSTPTPAPASTSSPRAAARDARDPGRPQLPARPRARRRDIFQMTFDGSRAPLRPARRLHGHLDGRAARSAPPPRS